MHTNLSLYMPGDPSMKPDVIAHTNKKKQERNFSIKFGDKVLQGDEIIKHLNHQQHYIKLLSEKIIKLEAELNTLNRSHN
jgi:hypothetical protein